MRENRTSVTVRGGGLVTGIPTAENRNRKSNSTRSIILIWIRYNTEDEIQEAWSWPREEYIAALHVKRRISPVDMRKGQKLA